MKDMQRLAATVLGLRMVTSAEAKTLGQGQLKLLLNCTHRHTNPPAGGATVVAAVLDVACSHPCQQLSYFCSAPVPCFSAPRCASDLHASVVCAWTSAAPLSPSMPQQCVFSYLLSDQAHQEQGVPTAAAPMLCACDCVC